MARGGPNRWGIACALAVVASGREAAAGPMDAYGTGPAGVAEVEARVARATDGTAAFTSPGGLAFGHGASAEAGVLVVGSGLRVAGGRASLDDPLRTTLALDTDIPLDGPLAHRLRLGLAVSALPASVARIASPAAPDPTFAYYQGRTERLAVVPALALRVSDRVGVGLGVDALAGLSGPADVAPGPTRALEARVEEDVTTVAALVAGVRVDPVDRLHLALVWRQRFAVPLHVTSTSVAGGVPISVDVGTTEALYDPHRVVLGASVDVTRSLALEADGAWARFSDWRGPLLDVTATLPGVYLPSQPLPPLFRDAWSARLGGAYTATLSPDATLALHAGVGFERGIVRDDVQQARSNLVDGDKLRVGLGATLKLPALRGLRFALGGQLHQLAAFHQAKRVCQQTPCGDGTLAGPDGGSPSTGIVNPGHPSLDASGRVVVVATSVGVDL